MRITDKAPETIVDHKETEFLTVFVDGAGSRPDGTGSWFAWICTTTKEKDEHLQRCGHR